MLHWNLAGPGRPVQLHERERWALRGHQRFDHADPLRPGQLEQHDRAGILHPGVPGTLRGHQRLGGGDSLRSWDLEQHDRAGILHPGVPGILRGH